MLIRSMQLLRLSKLLTIFVFAMFIFVVLLPYINGYGCDFNYREEFDDYDMVGSCRGGVLKTHIVYNDRGFSYFKKFLWFKYRNRVLLINISSKLPQNVILHSFPDFDIRYNHYMHNESLFEFYLIREAKNGEKIFVTNEPVDAMYIFDMKGQLSYF